MARPSACRPVSASAMPLPPRRSRTPASGCSGSVQICVDLEDGRRDVMRDRAGLAKRGILAAAFVALAAGAAAGQAGVNIGTLTCNVSGSIGYIITSAKSMACTFSPAGGPPQHYSGVIRKFGLDIGYSGEAVMTWVVFAPGSVARGALQGSYGGASAEVSAG